MSNRNIIIIGISTGGPITLQRLFMGLPLLNGSIIIVQHMRKVGNIPLAQSLNRLTKMDVKIANNGERLKQGVVHIAPSDLHLELKDNRLMKLVQKPKVCYVRPAVDITMKSVREQNRDNITGIVMTGIGRDGAEGSAHIKSIGGAVLAQDQESSVIWGMPKAAINLGCVDHVLSPEDIRQRLISQMGR
jgi:two-component system chemotaxis response regulator CheB